MPEIARLEPVDLRVVWPDEARDFTPWLAKNLNALGDVLGMDLELVRSEAPVGPFSLDILARDADGREVVIENQLAVTNYGHLGQLLIYASGLDAGVVVWIAKSFKDEYRQALDWLNQRTGVETEFYGVEVRAVKIDESRPAYVFDVVARPNEFRKSRIGISRGEITQHTESQRLFLQRVADKLRDEHSFKTRNASPRAWMDYPTGLSRIVCRMSIGKRQARVALYIDRPQFISKDIFDRLYAEKPRIEKEFGETLDWERLDDKKASLLALYREGTIDGDESEMTALVDWMAEKVAKFRDKVVPIARSITEEVDREVPEEIEDNSLLDEDDPEDE